MLCASPDQLTGTGTINAKGLVSNVNLVFDSTHGLKLTLDSLPNQDITINLDLSTPASNQTLGGLERQWLLDD